MRVYGDTRSGNCYKVKLLLEHLGQPYDWVPVDILSGETRRPDYLAKNPNGKTPLLELDDGQYLAESNAILNYLAEGSDYLPSGGIERARVLQWQFFEQYSHEPFIATSRFIHLYLGNPPERRRELEEKAPRGHAALGVMERHLAERTFFVGGRFTIADISLYAYTHVAGEGGFDLAGYPAVRRWVDRVRGLPGHVAM